MLTILYVFMCWLAADFISGIGHWFEDTYLEPGSYRLLNDLVIYGNIEHHRNPNGITKGTYLSTNSVTIGLSLLMVLIGVLILHTVLWQYYLVAIFVSHINQVHVWSHSYKTYTIVKLLQKIGLFQSVKHHSLHHKKPYLVKYCILTEYLNPLLDYVKFWRCLEYIIGLMGVTTKTGSVLRSGY